MGHICKVVTFAIDLFAHPDDLVHAGVNAEFATLAALAVNNNSSLDFCHILLNLLDFYFAASMREIGQMQVENQVGVSWY